MFVSAWVSSLSQRLATLSSTVHSCLSTKKHINHSKSHTCVTSEKAFRLTWNSWSQCVFWYRQCINKFYVSSTLFWKAPFALQESLDLPSKYYKFPMKQRSSCLPVYLSTNRYASMERVNVNMHKAKCKLWSQPCWYRYAISAAPDIKKIPARCLKWKRKLVKVLSLSCAFRADFLAFLLSERRHGQVCHLTVSLCCVHFRSRPDRLWIIC